MHAPVSCSQAILHPDLAFKWKRALFQAACEEVDQASLLLAPPFLRCPNDCNKHNDRAVPGQVSLCRHAHACMGCWWQAGCPLSYGPSGICELHLEIASPVCRCLHRLVPVLVTLMTCIYWTAVPTSHLI